jgi:beta-galactosidase
MKFRALSLLILVGMFHDFETAHREHERLIWSAEHRLGAYRRDDGLAPRRCSALQFTESGTGTSGGSGAGAQSVSLAGQWRFALDRSDAGVKEEWFNRSLADRIQLPGALQSQGYGDEISVRTPWVLSLYDKSWYLREDYRAYTNAGRVKVPFVCQPPRHYIGPAWYQRNVEIPPDWQGRRAVLCLERPHWETAVWVDDRRIGSNDSLVAPHEYDLGTLTPGLHRLSVRVDNGMILPYRPDAHSVSDSLNSTWNGIVGRVTLEPRDPAAIERLRLVPRLKRQGVEVTLYTRNDTGKAVAAPLVMLQVVPGNFDGNAFTPLRRSATIAPGDGSLTLFFPMGTNFEYWSEFNPKFYQLRATLGGNGFHSERASTFGMREIRTHDRAFLVNGRETCFRGTHNGGDFPLTGYPPTDVETWTRIIRICQDWGLNHMRFHSWCPPEAAFEAADRLGFYLQPECGMWNDINPGTPMERMLYRETDRLLAAYGNHPSFVLLSPSNEAHGRWKQCLPQWVEHYRAEDPRRLYTPNTGWSLIDQPGPVQGADYLAVGRIGPDRVRGASGWFGQDYEGSVRGIDVPVLSHEVGQWCAYPDYDIISKFTGYMQPGNYEIFRDSLAAHGLSHKDKDFAWASGRFQLACYKEEVEANLRTPGLAGFQLLDLHDYVGQGTALVGLLDTFWESKGYATPAEFRRFCSPTVPLARLHRRVFTTADPFAVDVEVAHYGAVPLTNAAASWQIVDVTGRVVAEGDWPAKTIPLGKNFPLGNISVDLAKLAAPQAYKLVVKVKPASAPHEVGRADLSTLRSSSATEDGPVGQDERQLVPTEFKGAKRVSRSGGSLPQRAPDEPCAFENDWNFWLYPARVSDTVPSEVWITDLWDQAQARLAEGGKVLFLPPHADLGWDSPPLATEPIFWNRLMNPAWNRMLGLWCDTNSPALSGFPTEASCDWQWTQIVRGVRAVNLDTLPRGLQPIVQAIDDWNRNWKLGAIFECRVGTGRLVVCSFDLSRDLTNRPVARQLRRSLLDYMAGPQFQPKTEVPPDALRGLWFDTRIMKKLGATATGEGTNAVAAVDGDPNTFWIAGGSGRGASGTRHPHALTIRFSAPTKINGIVCLSRQNDRDHLGDAREFTIETSDDGQQWREVARGELASTWSPQRVMFARTVTAQHLKFTALSGFGNDTSTAIAELAVLHAGPKPASAHSGAMEYRPSRSTSTDVDEGAETTAGRTNAVARPQ